MAQSCTKVMDQSKAYLFSISQGFIKPKEKQDDEIHVVSCKPKPKPKPKPKLTQYTAIKGKWQ